MTQMILRRLLQLPLIVAVVYTITVALAWGIPGNPLENPDRPPPPEIAEAMKRQYNLDSLPSFYIAYLTNATGLDALYTALGFAPIEHTIKRDDGSDAFRFTLGTAAPTDPVFNLGPSLQYRDWTVNDIVSDSLPVSITLGAAAIVIALVIGVAAGVIGAVKPNSFADLATLAVALVGISMPTFVIGTVLLLVFGVLLRMLPVGGWSPLGAVLPAITLSLPFAAYIARLTRMGMIDTLTSDFIRTARAKGVSESRVVLKHALKNAALPVVSFLGPATAFAMTGSFVVEKVFNIPGIGQHFVNAVLNKDLSLIMGVVLVFSTMLILFNLAVDVLYRWIDPRIT